MPKSIAPRPLRATTPTRASRIYSADLRGGVIGSERGGRIWVAVVEQRARWQEVEGVSRIGPGVTILHYGEREKA
jgi:hypothetical protein